MDDCYWLRIEPGVMENFLLGHSVCSLNARLKRRETNTGDEIFKMVNCQLTNQLTIVLCKIARISI